MDQAPGPIKATATDRKAIETHCTQLMSCDVASKNALIAISTATIGVHKPTSSISASTVENTWKAKNADDDPLANTITS